MLLSSSHVAIFSRKNLLWTSKVLISCWIFQSIYEIQVEKSRATKMSFSNDEFEECDAFPEDIEYIFRLDVKTGELTHKVCIGG